MLQSPTKKARVEPLGRAHGYEVTYYRADRRYTLSGQGGTITVPARDLEGLIMALKAVEEDMYRRHFTGDE